MRFSRDWHKPAHPVCDADWANIKRSVGVQSRGIPRANGMTHSFPADGTARVQALVAYAARQAVPGRSLDGADGTLRMMVHDACNTARACDVRVEQLVIRLKDAWHDLPEIARLPGHVADVALARVVTMCIHEYYRPGHDS